MMNACKKAVTQRNPHEDAGAEVDVPDRPDQCSCGNSKPGKWCDEPPTTTVYYIEPPEEIVWYCKSCAERKLMERDDAVDMYEW